VHLNHLSKLRFKSKHQASSNHLTEICWRISDPEVVDNTLYQNASKALTRCTESHRKRRLRSGSRFFLILPFWDSLGLEPEVNCNIGERTYETVMQCVLETALQ
jgi:hypothetical protein